MFLLTFSEHIIEKRIFSYLNDQGRSRNSPFEIQLKTMLLHSLTTIFTLMPQRSEGIEKRNKRDMGQILPPKPHVCLSNEHPQQSSTFSRHPSLTLYTLGNGITRNYSTYRGVHVRPKQAPLPKESSNTKQWGSGDAVLGST